MESEEEIKNKQKNNSSKKNSKVFVDEETELDSEKTEDKQIISNSGWTEMKDNKNKGSIGKLAVPKHSPREKEDFLSEADSLSNSSDSRSRVINRKQKYTSKIS